MMIVFSAVLIGCSICMLVLVGLFFTATTVPPWLDAALYVCFWFWWVPGILGPACLLYGITRRRRKKDERAKGGQSLISD